MKCVHFYEIISAFVDSEATALEQLALQEHLRNCPSCKNELASQFALKEMLSGYQSAFDRIDISAGVMCRISSLEEFPAEPSAIYAGAKAHKMPQWVAIAFMLAITAATVFSAHRANERVANAANDPAMAYTTYIYEHVNEGYYRDSKLDNNQRYKQVSFNR